jgi:hypothetical protein
MEASVMSRFGYHVVVRDYPYYNEETDVYHLIARSGHKHRTEAAARACLEKRTRVRCKCDRDSIDICRTCELADLYWLNAEVEDRGKPKRHHEAARTNPAMETHMPTSKKKQPARKPLIFPETLDLDEIPDSSVNWMRERFRDSELTPEQIATVESHIPGWTWTDASAPARKMGKVLMFPSRAA